MFVVNDHFTHFSQLSGPRDQGLSNNALNMHLYIFFSHLKCFVFHIADAVKSVDSRHDKTAFWQYNFEVRKGTFNIV